LDHDDDDDLMVAVQPASVTDSQCDSASNVNQPCLVGYVTDRLPISSARLSIMLPVWQGPIQS